MTLGTCGLHGNDSSPPAARHFCSENKSPAPSFSVRRCQRCAEPKPLNAFRRHNKGGSRWTCSACENLKVRQDKPWRSDAKRAYMRERRNKARGFSLCNDARRRAKEKGLPFELTPQDIQQRIEAGFCEVTGLPFDLTSPRAWNAPSLDQVTAGQGYTFANTRVVLYALNVMASDWGLDRVCLIAAALTTEG